MGKGGTTDKIVGGVKKFLINNPIGKASSVAVGALYNFKTNKTIKNIDKDIKTIREARAYDKAPDEADGGRAGRIRFMVGLIKERVKKTGK